MHAPIDFEEIFPNMYMLTSDCRIDRVFQWSRRYGRFPIHLSHQQTLPAYYHGVSTEFYFGGASRTPAWHCPIPSQCATDWMRQTC
jgi:hypothetical protein